MIRRPARRQQVKDYVLAVLFSLAIVWLVYLIWNIVRKEEIARHAVNDARSELSTLTQRETTLQQDVSELNTDRGKEATLRQTFGVAKPGEEVIIVVPVEASTTPPALPWWQKALNWAEFWK